jgi:hypothetical protein
MPSARQRAVPPGGGCNPALATQTLTQSRTWRTREDLSWHRCPGEPRPPAVPIPPPHPRKAVYREQLERGLRLAQDEIQKGTQKPRIVEILREHGFKTRAGREWTYRMLRNDLRIWEDSQVPSQDGDPDAGPAERPSAEPGDAFGGGPAAPVDSSGATETPASPS